MYININTHSYYSLLESILSIDDIINFAKINNQKYVFLTDPNLYGSIEFYNKAIENNLFPIIGIDVFYKNNKIIIFPTSNEGYKNLIKISSHILKNNDFNINDYSKDILIIFSGKKINEINVLNYFTTNTNSSTDIYINEARYLNVDDYKILDIMHHIKNDQKLNLANKNYIRNNNKKLLTEIEFSQNYLNKYSDNYKKFIELVSWKKEKKISKIISFPIKENISSKNYLRKLCEESFLEKFSNNKNVKEYKLRMEYELKIIDEMGFNDYFLIVQDFIAEANNRKILVGPGRGSSSGSLVSFLLSITKIDPIKYGLIFERFLNPNRNSLPDIDIDIMDSRRDEIIEYIFNKYGSNHVAHIITFQRIKSKMAIRDVGRVLDIDLKIIGRINKLIPSEYENDLFQAIDKNKELQNFYKEYPNLFDFANKLIGIPRQTGIHAAGIVLSNENLTDVIPIKYSVNDLNTTQISMDYLETLGLLKMDILGLNNLTIIDNVIKLISIKERINIDLLQIPLNDNNSYKEISNGNTIGIFQLESPGMRSTLRKIKPRNLEDISLVSALFRPGPQKNIPTFVERRFFNIEFDYIEERIKDILLPTNGIIVYQEQVIKIVQRVANFSPADSDIFRKIISKKNPNEMNEIKEKFISSAISNNFSKKISEKIFDYIEKFASYGFNHCHSISYALISYWMVYLKINFPIIFMSVLLKSAENSHDKINQYCTEAIRMNLKIAKPNINLSSKNFVIFNNIIYFGFSTIKGIGTETAKKIFNIRKEKVDKKFSSYEDCVTSLYNGGIGEVTIETLIYSGAFDEFKFSKKCMIENLKEVIESSKHIKNNNEYLFAPNIKEVEESENDKKDFMKKEIELIGFDFYSNIDDNYEKLIKNFSKYNLTNLSELSFANFGDQLKIFVKIISVTTRLTKFGKEMAFVLVSDSLTKEKLVTFNFENLNEKLIVDSYSVMEVKINDKGHQILSILEVINN